MEEPSRFGRYEVKRVLGEGQMGTVYLAKDPLIGRPVAIKVIREDPGTLSGGFAECRARFEREIRVAGTFSHPNIVTIYDVGLDEGESFVAMEYVDGGSLAHLLVKEPTLSFERVSDLVVQIASALDYAHERGVVHRDIKPANILLTMNGTPKVTDFGVARLADSTMTLHGSTYGSPAYMSPEQAASQVIGGTSDQFSLAIVAYRMLTGELPFAGESITAVIYRVLKQDPVPPELLNPLLSEEAGQVLLRSLSKHPKNRYPSCMAMAEELRAVLEVESVGDLAERAGPTLETVSVGGSSERAPVQAGTHLHGGGAAGAWAGAGTRAVQRSSRLLAWTANLSKKKESRVWSMLTAAVVILVAAVAGANWLVGGGDQQGPGASPAPGVQPARAEGAVQVPWRTGNLPSYPGLNRGGAEPEGQAGQSGGGLSGQGTSEGQRGNPAQSPAATGGDRLSSDANGGTPLYRVEGDRSSPGRAAEGGAEDRGTEAVRPEPGAHAGAQPATEGSLGSAEPETPGFESRWVLKEEGQVPAELAKRALNSAKVLGDLVAAEQNNLPTSSLTEASCVAVIPGTMKIGLLVGARHGKGLLTCRSERGWSLPSFISITGGSLGLQAGAQSTDIVLVFTDPTLAERLAEDPLPLGGGGMSLSAGPVGKTSESRRDVKEESEIYSYARARGLFAGVSVEGTNIKVDEQANGLVYGPGAEPLRLLLTFEGELHPELAVFLRSIETRGS